MREQGMKDAGEMDERLTRALERKPAVDVPDGFAARVAGLVPMRQAVALPRARYGLMAARICVAALLLAVMVVATRWGGRTVSGVVVEWVLCGELIGLAMWLGGMWKPAES
jgi:hypothetical protein